MIGCGGDDAADSDVLGPRGIGPGGTLAIVAAGPEDVLRRTSGRMSVGYDAAGELDEGTGGPIAAADCAGGGAAADAVAG